jgi:hypothetical protein
MDEQEPVIEDSHAAEHLEVKEPEHAKDEKCCNEVGDCKDRIIEVPDKGYGSIDRTGGGEPEYSGSSGP